MPYSKKKKIRLRKGITLFLLFIFLNQIFAPTIAYALTAGPTAPEATNFEPIDTTDMVNPLTGSFTYSLPLIEVPGPEGDYPLALSYHAGIQPNEEASWVGLGWSLNPGAIARNVNGYPDDWSGVTGTERDYWSGGSTTTISIGINVGLDDSPASVSAGLSFSEDTYKGFGVGVSAGLGSSFGKGSPFGIGVNIGISPYGGAYAGADLNYNSSIAKTGLIGSTSIGLQTNFNSVSADAGAGVSYNDGEKDANGNLVNPSASLLGASISTSGSHSFSLGGGSASSAYNANKGKITTASDGFSLGIPIAPGISIAVGYSYIRYWSDETSNFTVNGVINSRSSISNISDLNTSGDDNYSLPDVNLNQSNPDVLQQLGGTYPDFDNYTVSAQGLGGNMRPYIFSAVLYNQNRINNSNNNSNSYGITTSSTGNLSTGVVNTKWQFRFINDLSNSYRQQFPDNANSTYTFATAPAYGYNDLSYGYDSNTNRLEGSNHIEYFTNDEIADPSPTSKANLRGFIRCPEAGGFQRKTTANGNSALGSQIGGFMITNSSGVTYYYALPAYSFSEMVHSENINTSKGLNYNNLTKPVSYAYTWYLTAITGPDYVSRGQTQGLLDPSDWGYWVKFDYGQWSNNYAWRNPSEGYNQDLDNNFQNFSVGQKELYYLDAISTRSHTAIFEKEARLDGKSNAATEQANNEWPGLYTPQPVSFCNVSTHVANDNPVTGPTGFGLITPKTMMRLDNIYLFKNSNLPANINTVRQAGNINQQHTYTATSTSCNAGAPNTYTDVLSEDQDVIDHSDILALDVNSAWTSKCLRKIAFNYDYSLTPGVTNSYDPSLPSKLLGKLTLLSVDFQGEGGTPVTPPIQFQYDYDPTDPKNNGEAVIGPVVGQNSTLTFSSSANNFQVGDIVTFTNQATQYYCTLLSTQDGNTFNVLFLNTPSPGPIAVSVVKTKNPPYNSQAYDMFNCYKSDFVPDPVNVTLSRIPTKVSNNATDVWSLRTIESSIGANININYSGNTYCRSVLNNSPSFIVNANGSNANVVLNGYTTNSNINSDGTVDLIPDNPQNIDLTQLFIVGSNVQGPLVFYSYGALYRGGIYQVIDPNTYPPITIISVTDNDIKIQLSQSLIHHLAGSEISKVSFTTGNLIPSGGNNYNYGSGIRTQNITVDDQNGKVRQTQYDYSAFNSPAGSTTTSGVISYLPATYDGDNLSTILNGTTPLESNFQTLYRAIIQENVNKLLPIAREIPATGVLYENVAVSDYDILPNGTAVPADGKTVYQYEVFKQEMIGTYDRYNTSQTYPGATTGQIIDGMQTYLNSLSKRDRSIIDFTSRIGSLKRMITYDNYGNKITEKINHYLYDKLDNTSFLNQVQNYPALIAAPPYNNIGVLQERYAQGRYNTLVFNDSYNSLIMMSNKETYPNIQTGTTQIDYKNGTTTSQTNVGFDYYTGAVTSAITTDSYGNSFLSLNTPAYATGGAGTSTSVYPALGLKTHDDDGGSVAQHKQMLTQQASSYTFNISTDGKNTKLGVVTATVQTWGNDVPVLDQNGNAAPTSTQSNIWRMKANYTWLNTGTSANDITPYASFADYYAVNGNTNANWVKNSQITEYNVYSAALEAYDINNNYAASHMGYNNQKVVASGGPANYNEIAYSGAEDYVTGSTTLCPNLSLGTGTVIQNDSTRSHTGLNSVMLNQNQSSFIYTVPVNLLHPINYSVSIWAKASDINATGGLFYSIGGGASVYPTVSINKTAAGWYLLEMTIPASVITSVTTGNLQVGFTNKGAAVLYADDFKFQPSNASVNCYVYDQNDGELDYIIGPNGLFTRFQYDKIGRLVRSYKEVLGKSIIPIKSSVSYNYGRFAQPNWQSTGTTKCELSSANTNTGYQLIQQQDLNKLSSTYLQYRYVKGPASSGCPVTIYARLSGFTSYNGNNILSETFTVQLYSDPGGTVPYVIPSNYFTIELNDAQTGANGNQTYPGFYTIPAGSSVLDIPNIPIRGCIPYLNPFISNSAPNTGNYCNIDNVISLLALPAYQVLPSNLPPQ
jgi:hypothetical protein